jgi:hypothetical protein
MLRHVMGDSLFFRAMYQYASDPQFRFKTASTRDFQSVCEKVFGESLAYFFDEWIYGENYPKYQYQWETMQVGSRYTVRMTISQTTGTSTPVCFTMPLDLRLTGVGLDTTITVFNNTQIQTLMFGLPKEPSAVQLDPNNWILKDASSVLATQFTLLQNYPNPFNTTTVIPFELPSASAVRLEVFNSLGELVQTLASHKMYEAGRHAVQFSPLNRDGTPLPSGVYYCRLSVSGAPLQVRKMVYLR